MSICFSMFFSPVMTFSSLPLPGVHVACAKSIILTLYAVGGSSSSSSSSSSSLCFTSPSVGAFSCKRGVFRHAAHQSVESCGVALVDDQDAGAIHARLQALERIACLRDLGLDGLQELGRLVLLSSRC